MTRDDLMDATARAILSALEREGYAVVPVEPTPRMLLAAIRALQADDLDPTADEVAAGYRAAIAAAREGQ